jgi:hypothetical protein
MEPSIFTTATTPAYVDVGAYLEAFDHWQREREKESLHVSARVPLLQKPRIYRCWNIFTTYKSRCRSTFWGCMRPVIFTTWVSLLHRPIVSLHSACTTVPHDYRYHMVSLQHRPIMCPRPGCIRPTIFTTWVSLPHRPMTFKSVFMCPHPCTCNPKYVK